MMKNSTQTLMQEISVKVRRLGHGHVPCGCSRGWISQPYPVFVQNLRGFGETVYRDENRERVIRPENSVAYILPNETRRSNTLSRNGLDYRLLGISFEYHGGANFLQHFEIANPLPDSVQEYLRGAFDELFEMEEDSSIPAYRREIAQKRVGYTLLEMLVACGCKIQEQTPEWHRLMPAIQYLHEHYRDPFDVEELVRRTPFSRVHFYRIFKKQYKMAPQEYISRLRIREAAELLLETDLSVSEVGASVGWEDPFYFSKCFKSAIGVSPLNYRKNPGI